MVGDHPVCDAGAEVIGVFVLTAVVHGFGPKAYAIAPVRIVRGLAVVDGDAEIVWHRTPVRFGSPYGSKYRRRGEGWSQTRMSSTRWQLLRVEEEGWERFGVSDGAS